MAILTAPSYAGGIINGKDTDPYQSIYEASTTQNFRYATKLEYADGRVFRYSRAGGVALVQAFMTQSAVQESKAVEVVQAGHAQAVGAVDISVLVTTGSASEENAFADGWLVCNEASPAVLGDIYAILASKLQSTDTILDLKLATPWRNVMTASGEVSLNYNRFFDTVVAEATTITSQPAGVPLCPVPINNYYWSQTKGPCPLMVDTSDTVVIGSQVGIPGTNAIAGTCGIVTATALAFPIYGRCMSIATPSEPALIDLALE